MIDIKRIKETWGKGEHVFFTWCRVYGEGRIVSVNETAGIIIVSYQGIEFNDEMRVEYDFDGKLLTLARNRGIKRTLFFDENFEAKQPKFPFKPTLKPGMHIISVSKLYKNKSSASAKIYRVIEETEYAIRATYYHEVEMIDIDVDLIKQGFNFYSVDEPLNIQ